MQNTIYIGNQSLQLVSVYMDGRKLKKVIHKSLPLTLGSIVNGKIINPDEIIQVLKQAKKDYPNMLKNAVLIIDSNLIITKKIYIPILNKWQLTAAITNEFAYNVDNTEDLIYDAAVYKEATLHTLLCCGLKKPFLESYTNIFKQVDIDLKKIDIAINVIVKYVEDYDFFPEKYFVINIIDGHNMLSILFENGVYTFSTRYRLLADYESPELITELDQQLSSLIQFNKSKKSAEPINASYYAGIDEDKLKLLNEKNQHRNIKIAPITILNDPELPPLILPIAAGMTSKIKNDINLLHAEKKYKKKATLSDQKHKKVFVTILIILAFLIGSLFGTIQIANNNINNTIDGMTSYMNEPQTKTNYELTQAESNQTSNTNAKLNAITSTENQIKQKSTFNSTVLKAFYAASMGEISFNILTFSCENNNVSIDASGKSEQAAANYVTRLKALNFIDNVVYTGYTKDSATALYYFQINCSLKAGEANV